MPDPRNRRFGLTESDVGVLHTAKVKRATKHKGRPPLFNEKKSMTIALTREEWIALDRLTAVYQYGRGGANATRGDLIRYWIAGGRIY